MLATTMEGDLFVWGCGLTHQLGNRPRDISNPCDADEEPEDELRPYRVSSKQLEQRFVMVADGGAQHTVELAWDGSYGKPQPADAAADTGMRESINAEDLEPPAKRRLTDQPAAAPQEAAPQEAIPEETAKPADVRPESTEDATVNELVSFEGLAGVGEGKWKCKTCLCQWDMSTIKCQACDGYQPGLSEEAIAKMEAEKEAQHAAAIAKFQTTSTVKPTGFGSAAASAGSIFGSASSPSLVFGFGSGEGASSAGSGFVATGTSSGFISGFGSGLGSGFGSAFGSGFGSSSQTGGVSFGFGGSSSSSAPAFTFGTSAAPAAPVTKKLQELPDLERTDEVPVGDVFVHGSGECDQLGLGDKLPMRERRKPTLVKDLVGNQIYEIAVGAMHVLCVSAGGALYSWGCNDDGALGRVSSDGSDGGPSDVEPSRVSMPSGVAVRKVSCGDCHSCALDDRGRVWLWGTYKDSNGYIGIVHKRKQESEVLEKSSEPALVLEGCSMLASGANHTVSGLRFGTTLNLLITF